MSKTKNYIYITRATNNPAKWRLRFAGKGFFALSQYNEEDDVFVYTSDSQAIEAAVSFSENTPTGAILVMEDSG